MSIPIFSGKLQEARQNTDKANMRAAKAAAVTEYLQTDQKSATTFERLYDAENGKVVATTTTLDGYNKADQGSGANAVEAGKGVVKVTIEMKKGTGDTVTTEADSVKAEWVKASTATPPTA